MIASIQAMSDEGILMAQKRFDRVEAKQVLNRVKAVSMPFDWSINPYRGCTHGCSFCYARATHSFLGMETDDTFQNHILMKSNGAESLEKQLARIANRFDGDLYEVSRHVGLVAIGTATDPYQPIEAKEYLTRDLLKVLRKYEIATTITTRSPLILRDIGLLKEMNITSINISVNTLNREIWRNVEPATPFPMKRLETVQKLVDEGIRAGIFVAPILPFLTDRTTELETLFSASKQHKVQFVVPSVLRLAPDVKSWYFKVIELHYPHLIRKYREMYGGVYPSKVYSDALKKRLHTLMAKYELAEKRFDPAAERVQVLPPPRRETEQLSFAF
jgi:DNA repair photolyase